MIDEELIAAAAAARLRAFAPYSGFQVGAALRLAGGAIVTGCNVESASYGLTVCAERVALWKAISEGETAFTAVAVVTGADALTPPCGACRQLLWEFAPDATVHLGNLAGLREAHAVAALMPRGFGAASLPGRGATVA